MSEPTSQARSQQSYSSPSATSNSDSGTGGLDAARPSPDADPRASSSGVTTVNGNVELEFVGWMPGSDEPPKRTPPRLHHKKSRLGCQQCRSRHIKCNEVHPTCGSCQRHGMTCVWGRGTNQTQSQPLLKPAIERSASSSKRSINTEIVPNSASIPSPSSLPETTERRILELRLFHHYMAVSYLTLNVPGDPNVDAWSVSIPGLALKHYSLLYAIYAFTALHLSQEDPSFSPVWEKYHSLTLSLHREDVKHLSATNSDAACLTASYLRLCAFALLQSRHLEPYSTPLEWLTMSSLTGQGLQISAWKYLKDDPNSISRRIVLNAPGITSKSETLRDDESLGRASNRKNLLYLLHRTAEDIVTEPWSDSDCKAYEFTVSTIGSIQLAIEEGDYRANILRRLILFPMTVETEFTDLVRLMRPRALVILAYYFAILEDFSQFWWIGKTGAREVGAIQRVLPARWRDILPASGRPWYSSLEDMNLSEL